MPFATSWPRGASSSGIPHRSSMTMLVLAALILSCATGGSTYPLKPTFAFARHFIRQFEKRGVMVQAVKLSKYESLLPGSRAAWIQTDQGILNAAFFDDTARAGAVRLVLSPERRAGRHRYLLRDGARTRFIDANRPLWLIRGPRFVAITDSKALAGGVTLPPPKHR